MENIIQNIAIWTIPVLLAITLHEVSHGYVAKKLGDSTAFMLGRLTLNPFNHIDLVGTVIMPIALLIMTQGNFVFGWAKPVPVNTRNLKKPKRDMALVAAAGPISNFAMAIGWACVLKLGLILGPKSSLAALALVLMGQAGIFINLVLGLLNLIPIPPLDGSRVLSSFLPAKLDYYYNRIEPYGFFILVGLMIAGVFGKIIGPPLDYLSKLLLSMLAIT